MSRQVWKENIKVNDKKKDEKKKNEKKQEGYNPLAFPFGADELLLKSELDQIEKDGGR